MYLLCLLGNNVDGIHGINSSLVQVDLQIFTTKGFPINEFYVILSICLPSMQIHYSKLTIVMYGRGPSDNEMTIFSTTVDLCFQMFLDKVVKIQTLFLVGLEEPQIQYKFHIDLTKQLTGVLMQASSSSGWRRNLRNSAAKSLPTIFSTSLSNTESSKYSVTTSYSHNFISIWICQFKIV